MVSQGNSSQAQAALREQSLPELVKQLAEETTTLVRKELDLVRSEATRAGETAATLARQELQLAKAEMAEKGRKVIPGIGMVATAGAAGLLAAGALTAFAILALDGIMANWLAALVVGLVYAVLAATLYHRGKARVREAGPLVPEQTVQTIKEDVKWAKTLIGSESR